MRVCLRTLRSKWAQVEPHLGVGAAICLYWYPTYFLKVWRQIRVSLLYWRRRLLWFDHRLRDWQSTLRLNPLIFVLFTLSALWGKGRYQNDSLRSSAFMTSELNLYNLENYLVRSQQHSWRNRARWYFNGINVFPVARWTQLLLALCFSYSICRPMGFVFWLWTVQCGPPVRDQNNNRTKYCTHNIHSTEVGCLTEDWFAVAALKWFHKLPCLLLHGGKF